MSDESRTEQQADEKQNPEAAAQAPEAPAQAAEAAGQAPEAARQATVAEAQAAWLENLGEKLSKPQQAAMAALREGNSIARAATHAGVNRCTIHRWIKADPSFLALYTAWQQEMCESGRARLIRCTDEAVECVTSTVGSDPKLAFNLLKELGMLRQVAASQLRPDLLARQLQVQEDEQELTLSRREFNYHLDRLGIAKEDQDELMKGLERFAANRRANRDAQASSGQKGADSRQDFNDALAKILAKGDDGDDDEDDYI